MTPEQQKYYELGKFEVLMTYKRIGSFSEIEHTKAVMEIDRMLRDIKEEKHEVDTIA
jgi:hypothetical protein